MGDQEDYGDVDEGLAERIRGALRATPRDVRESTEWAVGTWTMILADYAAEARRQERVTEAYLEARLGMRL